MGSEMCIRDSTKGFRNIYFGSGAPASSLGANGDVYINIG